MRNLAPEMYVCVWSARRFLTVIVYTCAEFDEHRATDVTREFFELTECETQVF
jgi:hypothetical protein